MLQLLSPRKASWFLTLTFYTADQVVAGLRKLTDKKVRYLISSHSALDHASGAWYFRDDKPTYIATKNQVHDLQMQESVGFNERKESKDPRNAVYKGKELVKPDIGFDGNLTLYFGGLTFQITAEGRGHSTGDLTVFIPQKRVFLMGDLLDTEVHPGQGESGDIFLFQRERLDRDSRPHHGSSATGRHLCAGSWAGAYRARRERSRRTKTLFRRNARRSR